MKDFFLKRIEECESTEELNYIVEQASFQIENNADYDEIYNEALKKARSWMPNY